MKKVYPWFEYKGKITDTLVISRMIWTNLLSNDFAFQKKPKGKKFPPHLMGKHSLEAWGMRLGEWKGDYAKQMKAEGLDPWKTWNPMMQEYCEQDVIVNEKFLNLILSKKFSAEAIELESQFLEIILEQEQNGVYFDVKAAEELYTSLIPIRESARQKCYGLFPDWYRIDKTRVSNKAKAIKTPTKDMKFKDVLRPDVTAGASFSPIKLTSFNPGSADHIIYWLKRKYAWEPVEFTEKGKPKTDDDVLKNLSYPEAKIISEYQLIDKRISQIAEGKNAWLKKVNSDGRIHGTVNTCGTVTGRCSHSNPNLGQVPASDAPYGHECRSLFYAPEGWTMVGADASGLELRCLASFMGKWDDGEYAKVILEGDIHTVNQKAAGLPTRPQAKTFIYGFLYGAGNAKIGKIVDKDAAAGGKLKAQFLRGLPALGSLMDAIQKAVDPKSFYRKKKQRMPPGTKKRDLKGLDGRILHCRSSHSALNLVLQSAGAIVMKKVAVIAVNQTLPAAGLIRQEDYRLVLNVHDELQAYVKPGKEKLFGDAVVAAIRLAGEHFDFRCPLDGEWKAGRSWAETH